MKLNRGLLLHPTLAIAPDRLALGVLGHRIWTRDIETYGKSEERGSKSIKEKYSFRWIEGYQQVCQISQRLPDTQCVYMADRESDIYELQLEAEQQDYQADYLIRASHDRIVLDQRRLSEEQPIIWILLTKIYPSSPASRF